MHTAWGLLLLLLVVVVVVVIIIIGARIHLTIAIIGLSTAAALA